MDQFRINQILDTIFRTSVDAIVVINENGIIQMANPAIERLFGYSLNELLYKSVNILMHNRYAIAHDSYIKNYLNTDIKHIIGIGREVECQHKNGSIFPCDLSVSELMLEDGSRLFAGTIHDISVQKKAQATIRELNNHLEERIEERTAQLAKAINNLQKANAALRIEISERIIAEEELRKSKEEAQLLFLKEKELSDLKSRFISTASHEFRTPLSSILSSAKLIGRYQDEDGQEKRLKHISRIQSAVNSLNNILDDLLSWSKLEEGKILYNPVSFNLPELAIDALEEVQVFAKNNQQLIYNHIGDSGFVTLDPLYIKNILLNLLSNAVKYSGEGQVIQLESSFKDGKLHLKVKDKGIGIPIEDQAHLFDRFFRANNVSNIQGTGLGLNIVKKYIDIMEGNISFESDLKNGTVFHVTIPLKPQPKVL